MGGGSWSTASYTTRAASKAAAGKSTFDYHDTVLRTGKKVAHDRLNPKGVKVRESRDSVDHPNSVGVALLLDVTGSMGQVPITLQTKLTQLNGLVLRKGYLEDPQFLMMAIGDAKCDTVPLQVGQFESDNRMDEDLEAVFLEGGGGGNRGESYEIGMYFLARHTVLDCVEKRGHKGYAFLICDEPFFNEVRASEVNRIMRGATDESDVLDTDIPIEQIVAEVQAKYNLFVIRPTDTSWGGDTSIHNAWQKLVGAQNVIVLEDLNATCETIALAIGVIEGTLDLDDAANHLADAGVAMGTIEVATKAVAALAANQPKTAVASGSTLGELGAGEDPSL